MRAGIRLCGTLTLLIILGCLPACYGPEPFTGGVLVETAEALTETPGAVFPVPCVPDTGSASNGDAFSGITDASGRDAHPFVSTLTTWTVTATFPVVVDACPI